MEDSKSQTRVCALCAEDIPLNASECPYCGAKYAITSQGYCQACHQVRTANAEGQCSVCGSPLFDSRVESQFIGELPSAPSPVPSRQPQAVPKPAVPSRPRKGSARWLLGALMLVGGAAVVLWAIQDSLALIPGLLFPATSSPTHTITLTLPPSATLLPNPTDTPPPSRTITPTRTAIPTNTPIPPWIADFASPWLAAAAQREPFFTDDFSSSNRGWELTTGDGQHNSGIRDGVLQMALADLDPVYTNPVIHKSEMILTFDARLALADPDASLELSNAPNKAGDYRSIRLFTRQGQAGWAYCARAAGQDESCTNTPDIQLTAGDWVHFLVIFKYEDMALYINETPAFYIRNFRGNNKYFLCSGSAPNRCEIDNLELWFTSTWSVATPSPGLPWTAAVTQPPESNPTATRPPQVASPTSTEPSAETGSAQGLVQWNDQPIAGVTVKLCIEWKMFGGCQAPVYSGVSGNDGWYAIANIPPGEYRVASQIPGQSETGWMGLRAVVQAGQTVTVKTLDVVKDDLQLASPANNSTVDTSLPTLSWQAYSEAAYYKLYVVDQTNNYTTVVNFERVDGTSFTFSTPQAASKYYWSLSAYNGNGTKIAESDSWYFTIVP